MGAAARRMIKPQRPTGCALEGRGEPGSLRARRRESNGSARANPVAQTTSATRQPRTFCRGNASWPGQTVKHPCSRHSGLSRCQIRPRAPHYARPSSGGARPDGDARGPQGSPGRAGRFAAGRCDRQPCRPTKVRRSFAAKRVRTRSPTATGTDPRRPRNHPPPPALAAVLSVSASCIPCMPLLRWLRGDAHRRAPAPTPTPQDKRQCGG